MLFKPFHVPSDSGWPQDDDDAPVGETSCACAIVGSFHQVSHKHLDRYLDEFEFRYNNPKNKYLFRDTLMRLVRGSVLPYEQLTA